MNTIEKHYPESDSLVVLIHGVESSKGEWLEKNGYTKGGNLISAFDGMNQSWIACDLYGHGDFKADEKDFDQEDISDELWPKFVERSVDAQIAAIERALAKGSYSSLTLVTYSAGCLIGVYLLKRKLPIPVNLYMAAVPIPEKDYDDEFSLHNNLEVFTGRSFIMFSGSEDEDVSLEEARWFFQQIPTSDKKQHVYASGHSLPLEWVHDAADYLREFQNATTTV